MQNGTDFICDKCGGEAGNGGVRDCVVVSDLNLESGLVVNYHFCRENKCDKKLLRSSMLTAYLERQGEDE